MVRNEKPDPNKIRIGNEIRAFVKKHNNNSVTLEDGEKFMGILGQSALDKAFTGRYTDLGLRKLMSKGFVPTINSASEILGGYRKDKWDFYIGDYVMAHMAIGLADHIEASLASVSWDDKLPGLVLHKHARDGSEKLGDFRIPHERSPTIFIQDPYEIGGVTIIVATMIGEPCMRGIILGVENTSANSYIPIASPIVLRKLDGRKPRKGEIGLFKSGQTKHDEYKKELLAVSDRRFCNIPVI